ncbi:Protein T20B5.2 [Aphelenchoides avenae]|nr:Protein T20B5.2 [Aphelenchus avenae]
MPVREHPVRVLTPGEEGKHRFKKIGSEEVHTIESYERKVHGEGIEPSRQFSTNSYTERRTYGRDENGEVVVKIEKDPKEPVRPVSPVRPVTRLGRETDVVQPISHMDTLPLHIPRIPELTNRNRSRHSDRSSVIHRSPVFLTADSSRSYGTSSGNSSASISPRSGAISADSQVSVGANSVPLKKVIRKSRMVSIYDGRPVSPYVESVHYEPAYPVPSVGRSPTVAWQNEDLWDREEHGVRERRTSNTENLLYYGPDDLQTIPLSNLGTNSSQRKFPRTSATARFADESRGPRRESAWIMENPAYQDY